MHHADPLCYGGVGAGERRGEEAAAGEQIVATRSHVFIVCVYDVAISGLHSSVARGAQVIPEVLSFTSTYFTRFESQVSASSKHLSASSPHQDLGIKGTNCTVSR